MSHLAAEFLYLLRQDQESLGEQDAQHRLAHLGMRGDGVQYLPERVLRRQVEFGSQGGHSDPP